MILLMPRLMRLNHSYGHGSFVEVTCITWDRSRLSSPYKLPKKQNTNDGSYILSHFEKLDTGRKGKKNPEHHSSKFSPGNDMLLIAPSVCGPDDVMRTCELELDKLDIEINARKSCCLYALEPRITPCVCVDH